LNKTGMEMDETEGVRMNVAFSKEVEINKRFQ
jgi:hypothetical protein